MEGIERNLLLASLPPEEMLGIASDLELVPLGHGQVLHESDEALQHCYFPADCAVSVVMVMANGASTEVAVVGYEGLIGISHFMGRTQTLGRGVVLGSGHAYRLEAAKLSEVFARSIVTQQMFLRYTQAVLTQMAQTSVCNRHHPLDQQLCRWLLMSSDRLRSDSLSVTHRQVAALLGVRREGVSETAGALQAAGLITYKRGHITIADRPGLQRRSCECYGLVKDEFNRLLPSKSADQARSLRNPVRRPLPRS